MRVHRRQIFLFSDFESFCRWSADASCTNTTYTVNALHLQSHSHSHIRAAYTRNATQQCIDAANTHTLTPLFAQGNTQRTEKIEPSGYWMWNNLSQYGCDASNIHVYESYPCIRSMEKARFRRSKESTSAAATTTATATATKPMVAEQLDAFKQLADWGYESENDIYLQWTYCVLLYWTQFFLLLSRCDASSHIHSGFHTYTHTATPFTHGSDNNVWSCHSPLDRHARKSAQH